MTVELAERPTRLWIAVIMNVFVASISIVALFYLLLSSNPNIPDILRPHGLGIALALGPSGLLVIASVLALLRIRFARWLMLGAAVLYFGMLGLQSLLYILSPTALVPASAASKLWVNVIRNALEITINAWALLSEPTADFFEDAGLSPSVEPDDTAV